MQRQHATDFALSKLTEHGLTSQGWRFEIVDRPTVSGLGLCWFGAKLITLTGWYVDLNDEAAVHDTILHEIAHAIAGREAGHGPGWKAVAARIGAVPSRLKDQRIINRPAGKYLAVCPHCQGEHWMGARPKRQRYCRCTRSMGESRPPLEYQKQRPRVVAATHTIIRGEMVAHAAGNMPAPAPVTPPEIDELLNRLAKATGREAKQIRAALRRRGHKGGLR